MSAPTAQLYMNPLTLDALHFLQSITTLDSSHNHIDPQLCTVLEDIVTSIGNFLKKNLQPIVPTTITRFIDNAALQKIQVVYNCLHCNITLGKSSTAAVAHLVQGHRMQSKKKTAKELRREERKRIEDNGDVRLSKKARSFMSSGLDKTMGENVMIAEKLKQIPEYEFIEKELLAVIAPLYPDKSVKLFKFGSRISGIGTRNSDLDIFVDIDNSFHVFENRGSEQTQQHLKDVHNALAKLPIQWKHLVPVDKARVPIIKVMNAATKMQCDIGFSNSLGYCNTKLLEYLFELQPVARYMCIFMKRWLQRTRTDDILNTYNMSMMVIYFMQIRKYLPSIESLQADLKEPVFVGPWVSNFVAKPLAELDLQPMSNNNGAVFKYLQNFFECCVAFDFNNYAVCPYLGRGVMIKNLESEMPKRYTDYIKADQDHALEIKTMIVQDPFQLNHNLTKAVTPRLMKAYRQYFALSAEAMANLSK